jgi:GNAT superfamily N-acetyltransferase
MAPLLRSPLVDELPALGDLCLRSKAVWGYDDRFLEACRHELSFDPADVRLTKIAVAEEGGKLLGVAQVKVEDRHANLLKLFVEPARLRHGVGKLLFAWALGVARDMGASQLVIEADPGAAPFYRRMGAVDVGFAPSGSIAGRMLPKLAVSFARSLE